MQRKSKEIANKDKFIKDFLIARVKQLDTSSLDGLLLAIKQYFEPTETTPEQAELTPEQAEHSPVISEWPSNFNRLAPFAFNLNI